MGNNKTKGKSVTLIMDGKVMDKYDMLFLEAKRKAIKEGKKITKQHFASYLFSKLIPTINVSEFLEAI